MRSYYFDSVEGDQRLPHDSGIALTPEQLASLGVKYWRIPVVDGWEAKIDEVAKERDYKNRDVINVSKVCTIFTK
jgi:1,2-dihydroxy-3-keto-5-methylthiopentene dioxygenase